MLFVIVCVEMAGVVSSEQMKQWCASLCVLCFVVMVIERERCVGHVESSGEHGVGRGGLCFIVFVSYGCVVGVSSICLVEECHNKQRRGVELKV